MISSNLTQGNTLTYVVPDDNEAREPWLSSAYTSWVNAQRAATDVSPQDIGTIAVTPAFYEGVSSTNYELSERDSSLTLADTPRMNALFNQVDPQQGGNLNTTLPLNEAAGLHSSNNPPLTSYDNSTFDSAWMIQQGQGHLQVQQVGDPIFPTVVRHTISTPAIIALADSRLVHQRKHACWICGNKFTLCE